MMMINMCCDLCRKFQKSHESLLSKLKDAEVKAQSLQRGTQLHCHIKSSEEG